MVAASRLLARASRQCVAAVAASAAGGGGAGGGAVAARGDRGEGGGCGAVDRGENPSMLPLVVLVVKF